PSNSGLPAVISKTVGLFDTKAYYHYWTVVWIFSIGHGSRPQLRLSRSRCCPPLWASVQPACTVVPGSHSGTMQGVRGSRPQGGHHPSRARRSARNQADDLGSTDRSNGRGRLDRATARSWRP